MQLISLAQIAAIGFVALTSAHPGEHHERDVGAVMAKRTHQINTRRALDKCADKLEARGVNARALARRKATVERYSKKHYIRDTDTVLNTSHHYTGSVDITANSPEDVIFSSNKTCVINPEGEVGPFWVPGELIRSDLRENQTGVNVIIDGQFLDVETCEPIEGLYWDIWNCNATGVYSGVVENGNGNDADASNINATFLRGLQSSDSDGVVQFNTIFPGHYSGRTNHHHLIVHLNASILPNDTLTGGNVPHIGQLFWDQDLIEEVEATYPYSTNNITQTTNAEDRVFSDETNNTSSDPVFEYVYLGNDIRDGLFAWVTVAINTSASYVPSYSFAYTSGGGVEESGGDSPSPFGM